MNKLQKTLSTYALDDDKVLKRLRRPAYFSLKFASALVLGFIMVLAILPHLQTQPLHSFVTTIRVEINPAFDLKVDHNDNVIEIITLNPEATAFDEMPLLGQPVATVVDALIAFSIQAGFIDEHAVESDIVNITLVVDEDERQAVKEAVEHLGERLRSHLESLEGGSKVDIVFIKATLRELMEAREKNIPLGLFVLQGHLLLQDGTLIPMREFLKTEQGQALNRLTRSERYELRALERYLERLDDLTDDLEDLEDELLEAGSSDSERINALRAEIAQLLERMETIQERIDALDDRKEGYTQEQLRRVREERRREREREREERRREREEDRNDDDNDESDNDEVNDENNDEVNDENNDVENDENNDEVNDDNQGTDSNEDDDTQRDEDEANSNAPDDLPSTHTAP